VDKLLTKDRVKVGLVWWLIINRIRSIGKDVTIVKKIK